MNDTPVVFRLEHPLRLLADLFAYSSLMFDFGGRTDIGVDQNVVMLESWDDYFENWSKRNVTTAAWHRVEWNFTGELREMVEVAIRKMSGT
jgi:hypothetical protein